MHCRSMFIVVALWTSLGAMPAPAFGQAMDATAQTNALFDDYWQWVMRAYPEYATHIGDHRYDDRLCDDSVAAVLQRREAREAFRVRGTQIDAESLSPQDRVSLRILQFQLDASLAINKAYGTLPFGVFDSWAPVTQMQGLHLDLPQLVVAARFQSVGDYEAFLKRLAAVPVSLSQLRQRMQLAMATGWMPPKVAITGVPKQLEAQIVDDAQDSPAYQPFKTFPKDMPQAEQARLAIAGRRVIGDQLVPAFRSFKAFYETRYLDRAAQRLGLADLPGGMPYYQAWLDWNTTTQMTPRQIHDLGLAEVARIGTQMDVIVSASDFKGTRAQYQKFLSSDPQFFFTKPDDMLAAYRDIAKRADAALPKLFAELPRQTYGIRAMRPEEGDNAEHYTAGSQEGGRPGWFEANVNDLTTRTKWTMETLLLHEAVPGHHLQTARAQELKQLPMFRRYSWFTAYGEGWALYAESLGDEMGFYKDPNQKFGNLSFEMLRASRLVVDTGLHAFGWTRERAIDYMVGNTGMTRANVTAEVDRYLVWPGQATAYKVGELKIKELRAKAKGELGERFDLRRFHNELIDNGALPLSVLEQLVDEWIVGEKARAPRAP